jgi:hypothetical protein
MFSKENILSVLEALGTLAVVFGLLAGFMVLNTLHWTGAL